jgi:hypothetical protein
VYEEDERANEEETTGDRDETGNNMVVTLL